MAYYEYKGTYDQHIPLTEILDFEVKEDLALENIQDENQCPVTINTIVEMIKKENKNNARINDIKEEDWNSLGFQIIKRAIYDYRTNGEMSNIHSYIKSHKTMHEIKKHGQYDQLLEEYQKNNISIEQVMEKLKEAYHQLADQKRISELSIEFLPELIYEEAEDKRKRENSFYLKKDFYKEDEVYKKMLEKLAEVQKGDLVFTEAPYDHSIDLLERYKKRFTDKWKEIEFKYCHSAFIIKDFSELVDVIEEYEKDAEKDQSVLSRRQKTIQFIKYLMENQWIIGKNSNGVAAEGILSFFPVRVRNDEGTDWVLVYEYEYYKNHPKYKERIWRNNNLIPGSGIFYNFNRMWRSISFGKIRKVNKVMKMAGWEKLKDIRIPRLNLYTINQYLSEEERNQISKTVSQRIREKGFNFKTDNCTTFMYQVLKEANIKAYPYLLRDVLFYCPFKNLLLFPDGTEQSIAIKNISQLYVEDYKGISEMAKAEKKVEPFRPFAFRGMARK